MQSRASNGIAERAETANMQRILAAHMATAGLVLAGGLIAGMITPEPRTPQSIARNAGPAGALVKLPPISSSVPQSRPVLKSADRQEPARPTPETGPDGHSPEKLAGMPLARKVPPAKAPQTATQVAKPPAPLKQLSVKPAEPLDVTPLTPDLSRGPANLRVASVGQMTATFRRAGFDLDQAVQTGHVPRIAIETLPPDWVAKRMTAPERKTLFFEMMLPLVLIANDEIMADRQRILRLTAEGEALPTRDQAWLDAVLKKYRLSPKKGADGNGMETADILARVDAVPPALTLAQGAIESAWGRSRFARQGNAMFGQWTWKTGQGIVPTGREAGKTHEVRAFKSLLASVRAYMRNLNTSRAYREMRAERAGLRAANRTVTGKILARHLNRYSEEGEAYVEKVQKMIRVNRLDRFDTMGLTDLL